MRQQTREGYQLLDHVTDAFIEAWGPTFETALVQAGLALFDTMIEVASVKTSLTEDVKATGHDELELVYNWLEELLLSFEIRHRVFGQLEVKISQPTGEPLLLTGVARGEPYDSVRHGSKVEVKGVTYHLMEVNRETNQVTIKYLLDL